MQVFRHVTVDSTQAAARRRILAGRATPFAELADAQTAGRGRLTRHWHSPPGGLWMSVASPIKEEPSTYQTTPLHVTATLREFLLRSLLPPAARTQLLVKWPNDLLLHGRKLAGVLCEQWSAERSRWLLIGLGLNANNRMTEHPDRRTSATSLIEFLGHSVDPPSIAETLAAEVASLVERLETAQVTSIAERLADCLAYRNEPLVVDLHGRQHHGICRGIGSDGQLRLERSDRSLLLRNGEVSSPSQTRP